MTQPPLWGIGGICFCSSGSTAHSTETLILIVNEYYELPYEGMLEVHAGYEYMFINPTFCNYTQENCIGVKK